MDTTNRPSPQHDLAAPASSIHMSSLCLPGLLEPYLCSPCSCVGHPVVSLLPHSLIYCSGNVLIINVQDCVVVFTHRTVIPCSMCNAPAKYALAPSAGESVRVATAKLTPHDANRMAFLLPAHLTLYVAGT